MRQSRKLNERGIGDGLIAHAEKGDVRQIRKRRQMTNSVAFKSHRFELQMFELRKLRQRLQANFGHVCRLKGQQFEVRITLEPLKVFDSHWRFQKKGGIKSA